MTETIPKIQHPQLLLIDDDETFARVLARTLSKRGYKVQYATHGSDAIELAQCTKPDAILLDLRLDEESGLDLIEPLRCCAPEARLLLVTGFASIATAVQAIKRGADDYLAKPLRIEQVVAAIEDQPIEAHIATSTLSPKRLEWEHIQRVLDQHGGNVSATARALNMHRRTLQRKLQKKPVKN